MQSLIEAARSKKLDRIIVGYAVGAWAGVQAASIAAPTFFWPQWVLQAIIGFALIGLPIALIGNYILDSASSRPSESGSTGRLSIFAGGGVCCCCGIASGELFRPSSRRSK